MGCGRGHSSRACGREVVFSQLEDIHSSVNWISTVQMNTKSVMK